MNKTVHLTIHSILLIALFLLGCFVLDSCGKKTTESNDLEETGDRLEQLTNEYSDDDFFEDGETVDYADDVVTQSADNTDNNTVSDNQEVSADVDYTAPPARANSNRSGRSFMIVAGNYLVESNADEMVRKLKKKGYNDAEKVVFDLSQYYTVVAARYDDRSSADRTAQRLKNEGFDNYVLGSK